MQITTEQAPELIKDILKANLVPMLHSSPGIGKSSIYKQIAKEYDLLLIDLRLSQCDPTDLSGFPFLNEKRTKAGYVPMDTFPIVGDSLPKKADGTFYKGWLLLLDEFNSAPMSVQAAAYKLVLDKEVGQHKLHPKVYCVAAGNLASDKAIVNRLSTAMQSRVIHLQLMADFKPWINWGNANGIDYRILAYIGFRPEILHKFAPDHDDFTFPCPRTWEFLSDIIKPWKKIGRSKAPILDGTIGEGAAREFLGFCDVFGQIPTIEQILANPATIQLDDEPSIRYATAALIANHADYNNFGTLLQCITRMPIEFQVICLQAAFRREQDIGGHPEWKKWTIKNAQEFM